MPAFPPFLPALERFPTLRPALPAAAAQARRVAERLAHAVPRPELIAEFDTLLGEIGGGLLLVEGSAGAGATTLLCQLAAARPYPLWLPADDAGGGLAALCAQVIAFNDLPVPIVPPAADRDSQTLERLLVEAAKQRASNDPLVVLIDTLPTDYAASPPPFPANIPQGVVIVYACEPSFFAPIDAAARLKLPASGPVLIRALVEAAMARGLPRQTAVAVAAHSGRSFLYVALACQRIERSLLRRRDLPEGLAALHAHWWAALGANGQALARALAAAREWLPLGHAAHLSGVDEAAVLALLDQSAGLVEHTNQRVQLYHPATRAFVAAQGDLRPTHAAFVVLARQQLGAAFDRGADDYFTRQFARHIALSGVTNADELVERPWVLAQQRRTGDLRQSATDATWAVGIAAASSQLDQLLRTAIIGGTLATLGRTVSPDLLATALNDALDRGEPRDSALRRTRDLIDQLPDGRDKALVLRRIGEVCFERGIKSHAMRMLSEALDLEVPGLPRSWRDEREEAQVALARAAIAAHAPDRALGITMRIAHPERRGMVETEVVRDLIAGGKLTRAEEVAQAIGHAPTHEWAMAEVAAGHARAGNTGRFREVLGTLKTGTAIAWARAELASDAARHGDTSAVEQVALIASQRGRDEALGLVAQALVVGGQPASALMATRMVADRAVRARTLIELALTKTPNAAVALNLAHDDIRLLGDDERTPMIVVLASAYATLGELAAAMHIVETLEEGEPRDRGHSRIAAALARAGELDTAARIAAAIPDDDERGWTQHELANAYIAVGRLDKATALVSQIADQNLRARAEADLCIARARAGRVAGALTAIEQITLPAERARALSAIAGVMVTRGFEGRADAARDTISDAGARSRYTVALASALANAAQHDAAETMARRADRPLDRCRALLACARAAAPDDAPRATRLLAEALRRAAALGRGETVAIIIAAADLLVALDGSELLLNAGRVLDEVDSWWG